MILVTIRRMLVQCLTVGDRKAQIAHLSTEGGIVVAFMVVGDQFPLTVFLQPSRKQACLLRRMEEELRLQTRETPASLVLVKARPSHWL